MKKQNAKINICENNIKEGVELVKKHPFFGYSFVYNYNVKLVKKEMPSKSLALYVSIVSICVSRLWIDE